MHKDDFLVVTQGSALSKPASSSVPVRASGAQELTVEWAARHVLAAFKASEAAGYRSRDRQFAIELLEKAFDTAAVRASGEPQKDLIAAVDEYLATLNDGLPDWGIRVREARGRLATVACNWRASLSASPSDDGARQPTTKTIGAITQDDAHWLISKLTKLAKASSSVADSPTHICVTCKMWLSGADVDLFKHREWNHNIIKLSEFQPRPSTPAGADGPNEER